MIHKSQFLKGLKCIRFLYLDTYHKELADPADSASSLKPAYGIDVETAVYRQYFDGVNVYNPQLNVHELATATINAMKAGTSVIYQPTFVSFDGKLSFRGDILIRGLNGYRLVEIKSSTEIKVPAHIYDVGFQMMILDSYCQWKESKGAYKYKSRKPKDLFLNNIDIYLLYVNKEYIFNGTLDFTELFIEENVTSRAKRNIALNKRVLRTFTTAIDKQKIPEATVGNHCIKPDKCTFYKYCWKDIPSTSLNRVSRLSESKIKRLAEKGIYTIEELPANFEVSDSVRVQMEAELKKGEVKKTSQLLTFIKSVDNQPLIYLDFESIAPAIPIYIGTKPYQQICFQYSIIKQDKIGDTNLKRLEFLADPGFDPRREFIESLLQDTQGSAKIIVYNKAFESTRLQEFASTYPEMQNQINNRIERIIDLMIPFREKHYYHPSFQGKYSIKVVAPVMCPEISYDKLEIQNGTAAMKAYSQLNKLNRAERHATQKALLDYCYTDVLSMVYILRNLKTKI